MNINLYPFYSYSMNVVKESLVTSLTAQQKKILWVASVAFACLAAACYFIKQRFFFTGQGRIKSFDGKVREGEFIQGRLNGEGNIIFPDGEFWEGEFKDDKFTGQGNISFTGGKHLDRKGYIEKGIFKDILLGLEKMLRLRWVGYKDRLTEDIDIKIEGLQEDLPLDQCYYVYQTLKGLAKLNENLDEIKQQLETKPFSAVFYFNNIREFPFHLENRGSLISSIENSLTIFEKQYYHHKAQGTLDSFLTQAFIPSNFCFEIRAQHLQKYHLLNPVEDENSIDLDACTSYTKNSDFLKIIGEELRVYIRSRVKKGLDPSVCHSEEFKKYLIEERGITNIEGKDIFSNVTRKITAEDIDIVLNEFKTSDVIAFI